MLIHELAKACGVSAKAIRYYESIGLLPQPRRADNNYRDYAATDADRLRFIAGGRALGLSLEEIGEILAFRERGEAPCLYVLNLLESKLDEIETRIADLRTLQRELGDLQQQARGLPIDDVEGKACVCHLIQNRNLREGKDKGYV
jgi:DNA-binding transcriptional MerR regulator